VAAITMWPRIGQVRCGEGRAVDAAGGVRPAFGRRARACGRCRTPDGPAYGTAYDRAAAAARVRPSGVGALVAPFDVAADLLDLGLADVEVAELPDRLVVGPGQAVAGGLGDAGVSGADLPHVEVERVVDARLVRLEP